MKNTIIVVLFALVFFSCNKQNNTISTFETELETITSLKLDSIFADVIAVNFTGNEFSYNAAVTIESEDIDCDQYANWWEIFDEEGNLIYRRILLHSHANEQPFTRSGGPINIDENQAIYIRAFMHPTGYGGKVFFGSVECGFVQEEMEATMFENLQNVAPLPTDCLY